MQDLNAGDSPSKPHDSFAVKASRFGFAWMLFSIFMVLVCFAQFLIIALKPMQALGVDDNGVVRGVVVFDEPYSRPIGAVTANIKKWAADCTSMNKISIFDDLSSCLAHLSEPLAEEKLAVYESDVSSNPEHRGVSYARLISQSGCKRTKTVFDKGTSVVRYREGANVTAALQGVYGDDQEIKITNRGAKGWVFAEVSGEKICLLPNGESKSQSFKMELLAQITNKTETNPLGLKVHSYEDIN